MLSDLRIRFLLTITGFKLENVKKTSIHIKTHNKFNHFTF